MAEDQQQPSGAFNVVIQPATDALPIIPSASFLPEQRRFKSQSEFHAWAQNQDVPTLQALYNSNEAADGVAPHWLNMELLTAMKKERNRGAAVGETVATVMSPGQLQERGLLQNPDGVIPQVPNAGPEATSLPGSAEVPDFGLHRPDEPHAYKN